MWIARGITFCILFCCKQARTQRSELFGEHINDFCIGLTLCMSRISLHFILTMSCREINLLKAVCANIVCINIVFYLILNLFAKVVFSLYSHACLEMAGVMSASRVPPWTKLQTHIQMTEKSIVAIFVNSVCVFPIYWSIRLYFFFFLNSLDTNCGTSSSLYTESTWATTNLESNAQDSCTQNQVNEIYVRRFSWKVLSKLDLNAPRL